MPKVMEIVSYRTSGDREAFVAASREIDGWAQRQQGFVSRHVVHKDDGSWMDLLLWDNLDAAKAAADKFGSEMGTCAAATMIESDSVSIFHAPLISSLPS